MGNGKIVGAAWVPGLPHVLSPQKSPQWEAHHQALTRLRAEIDQIEPDALMIYSTQWISVLGTSFQAQPNPKGLHVDENWYELGDLPFDIKVDVALAERFAQQVQKAGLPTKTVNVEEFPIDTGTIVANRLLNPDNRYPVGIVSSWVYADAEKNRLIGAEMEKAVVDSGKRVFALCISALSTRYFTEEIDPRNDKVAASDDDWNKKMLARWESGDWSGAHTLSQEYVKAVVPDMQFAGFHWLRGVLESRPLKGRVLNYGPLWGTGAAVVSFREAK